MKNIHACRGGSRVSARLCALGFAGVLAFACVAAGVAPAQTKDNAAPPDNARPLASIISRCDTVIAAKIASLESQGTPVAGWTSVILRMDGALTKEREKQLAALTADIYKRLPIIESVAVRVPTRNLK